MANEMTRIITNFLGRSYCNIIKFQEPICILRFILKLRAASSCDYPKFTQSTRSPFAESNGRCFPDTKINMMPSSICAIFGGCIKCMQVVISGANILTFCINPFCSGGLNAVSIIFFQSSLNIIVNFLLNLDGFKWNFINFKHDTFSWSHPNYLTIGSTATKPSANKCRPLCMPIGNTIHINLG